MEGRGSQNSEFCLLCSVYNETNLLGPFARKSQSAEGKHAAFLTRIMFELFSKHGGLRKRVHSLCPEALQTAWDSQLLGCLGFRVYGVELET